MLSFVCAYDEGSDTFILAFLVITIKESEQMIFQGFQIIISVAMDRQDKIVVPHPEVPIKSGLPCKINDFRGNSNEYNWRIYILRPTTSLTG